MANWKVAKYKVEVLEHPNADALEIIVAGEFQLVSGKGNYTTGDTVIVVPAGSVLSNGDMIREYEKYLSGSKKNRVKSAQLRGEISQGITWPTDSKILEETFGPRVSDLIFVAPIGEDISELLGITKYEPPIPKELTGQVRGIHLNGRKSSVQHEIYMHDAYQFGAFSSQFDPDEQIVVTEKVHGSLCSYTAVFEDGEVVDEIVSSKGQLKKGLQLIEDPSNMYWKAVREMGLREMVKGQFYYCRDFSNLPADAIITVTGELVPVQVGYSYGMTTDKPFILLFDVEVDGIHLGLGELYAGLLDAWVPILYRGAFKDADVYELAKGREQVSGKELSIREGCVVTPAVPRKSTKGGFNLALKVINPKYSAKETGEEIN